MVIKKCNICGFEGKPEESEGIYFCPMCCSEIQLSASEINSLKSDAYNTASKDNDYIEYEPEETWICPHCKSSNTDSDACRICGAKFATEDIKSPMPGTIIKVLVTEGQAVKRGNALLILEAMKMENEILCPANGYIKKINAKLGAGVQSGELLITIMK